MKKTSFFSFVLSVSFLLLFFSNCFSQEVKEIRGPEFDNKNGVFKSIIGEDNTSFYVLRLGTKGSGVQNNIEKYNKKTFRFEWVKDVSFEKDLGDKIPSGDQFLKSHVILSKGKIYFIISLLETRKNSRSVYAKTISADKGEALGPAKLLAKEEDYKSTKKFDISFSPDTSLILIKSAFVPMSRSKTGTTPTFASFTCYNTVKLITLEGYKEVFTKEMPVSDNNRDLGITSVSTDNEGNLLCIFTHIEKQKDLFGNVSNFKAIDPGIGKMPLATSKLLAFDLNIDVNDHAYLITNSLEYGKNFSYAVITGIFIDVPCKGKKNCERKEGAFFMKVDLDHSKMIAKQYYYFDDKLHQHYRDLFDKANDYERLGAVASVIDKKTEDVYSIYMGLRETMLVTRFTKEGKLVWCKPLPRGKGLIDQAPGFGFSVINKKIHFIYTDDPKNMELNANDFKVGKVSLKSAITGANVVCVTIDDAGVIEQKALSVNERSTANFNPETIDNLSEQPPIYNLKNRDKEQFVRFELPKQ
jgi:hypothetical protein